VGGLDAPDHVLERVDPHVAAAAALGAHAALALQEPHARLEAEVARGQRADRADVDGVARVRVVELLAREGRDLGVLAAVDDVELGLLGDLVAEAHAARAQDAALGVEDDVGPEHLGLGLVLLAMEQAARLGRELEVVVLQDALAGLVADRAVHRVVQQDELQHRLARALDALGRGLDLHAVHHLRMTRGHRLGRLVRVDQAHAAVRRDR